MISFFFLLEPDFTSQNRIFFSTMRTKLSLRLRRFFYQEVRLFGPSIMAILILLVSRRNKETFSLDNRLDYQHTRSPRYLREWIIVFDYH